MQNKKKFYTYTQVLHFKKNEEVYIMWVIYDKYLRDGKKVVFVHMFISRRLMKTVVDL